MTDSGQVGPEISIRIASSAPAVRGLRRNFISKPKVPTESKSVVASAVAFS